MPPSPVPPSGHVFRVERKRGPVWYAKYRLPDGRQIQKKIGPAWTGRGRPAAGYVTKRLAEAWFDDVLARARRAELPGSSGRVPRQARQENVHTAMYQSRPEHPPTPVHA